MQDPQETNAFDTAKGQEAFNTLVEIARGVAADYIHAKTAPTSRSDFYKISEAYQRLLSAYQVSSTSMELTNEFLDAFTLNLPPQATPANTYNETRFIKKVNASLARYFKISNPNFTYTGQYANTLPKPKKENYPTQASTAPTQYMGKTMNQIFRAIDEDDYNQLFRLLHTDNIDINSQYNRFTPLIWAVRENNPKYVKLFLQMGANPDYEGPKQESPLAIAQRLGYAEIVDILTPVSTTPSTQILEGDAHEATQKALFEAIKTGNVSEVERIFALPFPFSDVDYLMRTALECAVESESIDMVKLLVLRGASVSEPQVYSNFITFIDVHKQEVWCKHILQLFKLEKQKQLNMMSALCLAEGGLDKCQVALNAIQGLFLSEVQTLSEMLPDEVQTLSDKSRAEAHSKKEPAVIPTDQRPAPESAASKAKASPEGVNLQLHAKVTAINLEDVAALEQEFTRSARLLMDLIEKTKSPELDTMSNLLTQAINDSKKALATADAAEKLSIQSAIQDSQKKLHALQMVQQALPSLVDINVQLNQSFSIPADESQLAERHTSSKKYTEVLVRSDKSGKISVTDRDEIRLLTSAMHRTVDMMRDGLDLMANQEFSIEKKAAFDANLKALAQEANVIAGKGTSGLYKFGVSLLIVAACLGVAAGLFAIIGALTGGVAILPFLAAHCEFGLTAAIMAGTSLSTGAAATLAGTTVFAAPAVIAGAVGAVAFFKSEKPPSVGASLEKLAKKIEPFEKADKKGPGQAG